MIKVEYKLFKTIKELLELYEESRKSEYLEEALCVANTNIEGVYNWTDFIEILKICVRKKYSEILTIQILNAFDYQILNQLKTKREILLEHGIHHSTIKNLDDVADEDFVEVVKVLLNDD